MKPQPSFQSFQDVLYQARAKAFIAGLWYGGIITIIITALVFKLNGWW